MESTVLPAAICSFPHLVTDFGRSSGFAYSKGGVSACAEQYGYAENGRHSRAAFLHDGTRKSFGYNYLPGTHLLGAFVHSLRII